MAATIMDGTALAKRIRADLAEEVRVIGEIALATVLVGDDPASQVYIRYKHRACEEIGMVPLDRRLPAETSEAELLELVEVLNADDAVDGILVQTPLPAHIDESAIIAAVAPVKDVDGFSPENLGRLLRGEPLHVAATPLGIMTLLEEYEVELAGAHAVVVGRSNIVGKPVAQLLLQANATVTMCHSRTRDLAGEVARADVLVAAVGVPHLVQADWVKEGAAVVDVGMNRLESGLVGDVDPAAAERAALITPVPGGVGPMTIACLLQNTVRAARLRRGVPA
jgi:methylenetetrahydrofolate dehydrogenase (NADP+)/methenyltetrahydrofolate cyclohydrolase